MPTINQLASISQVNGSAQIPVYDQNNGDARKMSVNTLLDYFQTSFAAPTVATNLYTPGAGFNITVPTPVAEQQWMLIQPAGTLATGTVTLPLNTGVPDGTEVLITSTQTITAFTIALNGAAAIFGNVSTLTAGAAVRYRYYLATNSWYNIVNDFFFNPVIIGTSLVLSGSASIGTTLSVTGATTLSSTLSVTGVSTLTGGAVVQGMTVGKGLAAVATNTAVGFEVLQANTTGNSNVGVGYRTLRLNEAGEYNFAGGYDTLKSNRTGVENTAVGALALSGNVSGAYNTAVGLYALGTQISGSRNVALGYYAGNYETGSNAFYVNNQDRTNTAGDKASSLMYGTFNATASSQTLAINAKLAVSEITGTRAAATTIASGTSPTIAPTKSITFISGTSAITTITAVTPFDTLGGCTITLIPTGAFTWTTAGNIAVAGTAVVNRALTMTYDSATTKWYPSYV
ncbi:hypothetical protein UFOVP1377_13 [uncultured Caudovirales phage]|uniref:Uncharacterized protein n=1 Tax=uncultured Caudovirales phage TaxID=2100421 RepID=A0A6J5MYW1_9CAUD|nr:hypothetical protein UFOVP604_9 [uncultured Caudovirales phage]CAB4183787.1 hypothetical protein UFOVP1108_9 [uncultured Caudovirales phage]CAB4202291.1 hypothetical protein UFOVP1377_13 [uncultured Caudovirales phage]CAB4215708.1 hypothetical protein UFOVP1472_38 [uncultured Caudovirales phage]CAB5230276.1 hypothetical protein UFOVP1559_50 [uncultured Caudovirales phage]